MFDHVTIRVSDRDVSERLYTTVLRTLGIEPSSTEEFADWGDFSLSAARTGEPVTRRLHVAFFAPSRAHVDEFWRVGTDVGLHDDGAPGPRPQYSDDYYGSFLRDPDGNSVEAVHHGASRRPGAIDHLWIRVADVDAAQRFYDAIAPYSRFVFRGRHDAPDRAQFVGEGSSFSVVAGEPTEHLHMAFPAADDATVDAFHAAATAAGHRDNGAPAERPLYHRGYYAAFVLDPDGNNVELVNHNRP